MVTTRQELQQRELIEGAFLQVWKLKLVRFKTMKSILELNSKKVLDSRFIPALNPTEAYKESRCDRRSTNRRLFGFVLHSAII